MRHWMWTLIIAVPLSLTGMSAFALEENYNNAYHPMASGKVMSFSKIDKDRNGSISASEAQETDLTVARNMHKYDIDKNGQLSQSEFSALESSEPSAADYWIEFFSQG